MLDIKKVGIKIVSFRKKIGLSQEKLAELLCISPQAVSKWENGHSLPEVSLLPVLSQIFECTIDELLMPAYTIDEKIEEAKPSILELQAEHIAKHIIKNLEANKVPTKLIGFDDDIILSTVQKTNPNMGSGIITRGKPQKNNRYTSICITVSTPQKEYKLIQKVYSRDDDNELNRYDIVSKYTLAIPHIYHIDFDKKMILMEDLNDTYIQGNCFDEKTDNGIVYRSNYDNLLTAMAEFHATFWENNGAFEQVGLDWRLESKENLLAHISGMEKDFIKYTKNEEAGKIPKVWEIFENHMDIKKLEYFQIAIKTLKEEYIKLIDARFHSGKNITIIHGDLHPGNTFLSKSTDRTVKFIDLEAVRMGLCTEDLAMFLALHIQADKKTAQPMLDHYYNNLCNRVKEYPYDMFIQDYKISIMENMFFTIRLINRGIFDFSMRDKAVKAFETFVLEGIV